MAPRLRSPRRSHRPRSCRRRRASTAPVSTRSTARPGCTVTPRCSSTRVKILRTLLLCPGRIVSVSPASSNPMPDAGATCRSRCCIASSTSTPAAPPPTIAMLRGRVPASDLLAHFIPARHEILDRLYRQRVLRCARDLLRRRSCARIHRDDVIGQDRPVRADHRARIRVEAMAGGRDEATTGETRQRQEIDVAFVARVMPGDPAGKHSRVRRIRIRARQHELGPGERGGPESSQHFDMAVAAAEQHQALHAQWRRFYIPISPVYSWRQTGMRQTKMR